MLHRIQGKFASTYTLTTAAAADLTYFAHIYLQPAAAAAGCCAGKYFTYLQPA